MGFVAVLSLLIFLFWWYKRASPLSRRPFSLVEDLGWTNLAKQRTRPQLWIISIILQEQKEDELSFPLLLAKF